MLDRPCPAKRGEVGQRTFMVYVYILQSLVDKKYYIGITKNLVQRLEQHNKGKVTSTKKRRPLIIVYQEEYTSYIEAREREIEIKSYKGGNSFKKLLK